MIMASAPTPPARIRPPLALVPAIPGHLLCALCIANAKLRAMAGRNAPDPKAAVTLWQGTAVCAGCITIATDDGGDGERTPIQSEYIVRHDTPGTNPANGAQAL